MYFVVNKRLKMGKGKIAAQVAHAAIALSRKLDPKDPVHKEWDRKHHAKIVLAAEEATFTKLVPLCDHVVTDMGLTQVPPGSQTVLRWLPRSSDEVPAYLRELKLL